MGNPTIAVRESCHGCGGAEGFYEGEGDSEMRGRGPSNEVEDMACDGVAWRGGDGRGNSISGLSHYVRKIWSYRVI